ncbi:Rieske (2Fe-2S) protein [Cohnella cholangitidis]|uniref:Rieske 2Fe-2S domain-containing protein n=1 Tax=Cohnella cholangitidis TaxID=2598458 RepID=A0A7G5C2T6_9BACL|nr:Rieske 2Fe-2S domain-containing protein [Cohnella cholangitidis]QMV43520.1 Rieske 2Fe-2S domain-containing protein [Cohnella cholangitidis]
MNPSEIELGPLDAYAELPAEVMIDHTPYWLVRTSEAEGGFRLLLAICPHAGGEIRPLNDVLFCPLHFWTFHAESGVCLNDPSERLLRRRVIVRDGRLFAVGEHG